MGAVTERGVGFAAGASVVGACFKFKYDRAVTHLRCLLYLSPFGMAL